MTVMAFRQPNQSPRSKEPSIAVRIGSSQGPGHDSHDDQCPYLPAVAYRHGKAWVGNTRCTMARWWGSCTRLLRRPACGWTAWTKKQHLSPMATEQQQARRPCPRSRGGRFDGGFSAGPSSNHCQGIDGCFGRFHRGAFSHWRTGLLTGASAHPNAWSQPQERTLRAQIVARLNGPTELHIRGRTSDLSFESKCICSH